MIDWEALTGHRSVAGAIGPFPHRPFLEVWWRHRGTGFLQVVGHASSVAAVVVADGTMSYAGDPDVTDYHSPLGDDPGSVVVAAAAAAPSGTRLSLDSMPDEVARPVAAALGAAGISATIVRHQATMVLDLDGGKPLASLDSKQRHEVRRKARRFSEAFGEPRLATGSQGFDAFVTMHRMAGGEKAGFFDDDMEAFFGALLEIPGATMDVLLTGAGDPVAAAFGFTDDEAYYLYNSAFDPGAGASSPGIVMIKLLIERESAAGRRRFDLLKGDEAYKQRLGARPRALFMVEGVV